MVRISVLGGLRVEGDGGGDVLGAAKERSLLSALASSRGSVVSSDSPRDILAAGARAFVDRGLLAPPGGPARGVLFVAAPERPAAAPRTVA